jgi:hypothetical protein
MESRQFEMLLVILWAEVPSRKDQNHRVITLELAQSPSRFRMIS